MKRAYGFTIVELLIVIVVIGILAGISIVAYSGISNNANDTAVKADLRAIAAKVQEYQILSGTYPASGNNSAAFPGGIRYAVNKQSYQEGVNMYYCVISGSDNPRFALAARSKSGAIFVYREGTFQGYSAPTFTTGNSICTGSGIPSTELGFEYHYGRDVNSQWNGWTNG